MGVGKSTVCRQLLDMLKPGVYLDGDWCWSMNPFVVSEENKAMVVDNITYLLKSYLNNSSFKYIIFCWVIHREDIFSQILISLRNYIFKLYKISLICSEPVLRERLTLDVNNDIRKSDVIERSIERLELYDRMDTIKINVSNITAEQAARKIYEIVR